MRHNIEEVFLIEKQKIQNENSRIFSVSVQVFDLSNFVDNVLDYQVYNGYEK